MRFLVTDPFRVFCLSRIPVWRMAPVISYVSYVSSIVLFFAITICSMLHSGDEKKKKKKAKHTKLLNIFWLEYFGCVAYVYPALYCNKIIYCEYFIIKKIRKLEICLRWWRHSSLRNTEKCQNTKRSIFSKIQKRFHVDFWQSLQITAPAKWSWHLSRLMTKPTKWHVRPAKTQISLGRCLGICPVWSVFAVRVKKPWVLSYQMSAQRSHWSEWADGQGWSESSLGAQSFCWFCHEAAHFYLAMKNEFSTTVPKVGKI